METAKHKWEPSRLAEGEERHAGQALVKSTCNCAKVPKFKKNIEVQEEAGCKASQGKRQAGNSLAGGKCTKMIKYSYKYMYKQPARQAGERDIPGRFWQEASVTKLVLE